MPLTEYDAIRIDASNLNGIIYCHCLFEWKDNIKKLGFRWFDKLKLWYIQAEKFTNEIYQETKTPRFSNNTSSGVLHYYYVHYCTSGDIRTKMMDNQLHFKNTKYGNINITEKQDIATKYAEEMAELGKRQEVKSNKEVLATKKKLTPPKSENAEKFGAGYDIENN